MFLINNMKADTIAILFLVSIINGAINYITTAPFNIF